MDLDDSANYITVKVPLTALFIGTLAEKMRWILSVELCSNFIEFFCDLWPFDDFKLGYNVEQKLVFLI